MPCSVTEEHQIQALGPTASHSSRKISQGSEGRRWRRRRCDDPLKFLCKPSRLKVVEESVSVGIDGRREGEIVGSEIPARSERSCQMAPAVKDALVNEGSVAALNPYVDPHNDAPKLKSPSRRQLQTVRLPAMGLPSSMSAKKRRTSRTKGPGWRVGMEWPVPLKVR